MLSALGSERTHKKGRFPCLVHKLIPMSVTCFSDKLYHDKMVSKIYKEHNKSNSKCNTAAIWQIIVP